MLGSLIKTFEYWILEWKWNEVLFLCLIWNSVQHPLRSELLSENNLYGISEFSLWVACSHTSKLALASYPQVHFQLGNVQMWNFLVSQDFSVFKWKKFSVTSVLWFTLFAAINVKFGECIRNLRTLVELHCESCTMHAFIGPIYVFNHWQNMVRNKGEMEAEQITKQQLPPPPDLAHPFLGTLCSIYFYSTHIFQYLLNAMKKILIC